MLRKIFCGALIAVMAVGLAGSLQPASAQRGSYDVPPRKVVLLGEEIAKFTRETDDFEIDAGNRRFTHLRMLADRSPIKLFHIEVTFGNGKQHIFNVGKIIKPNSKGILLELPGRARRITKLEAAYQTVRGSKRRGIALIKGRVFVPPPVAPVAKFVTVGDVEARLRERRISIPVGRKDGRLIAIRLRVAGRDVFIRTLRVVFGNGSSQNVSINGWLEADTRSDPIRLAGGARFIDQVVLDIRPRRGRRRAAFQVLGQKAIEHRRSSRLGEAVRLDRRGLPRRHELLGSADADFSVRGETIRVGRDVGRIEHLVVRVLKNDAYVDSIIVTYGRGREEVIKIDERFRAGSVTPRIRLERPRRIRSVQIKAQSRPGGARAKLQLYARLAEGWRRPRIQNDPRPVRLKDGKWAMLASRSPALFKAEQVIIPVGRGVGPINALRLVIKRHDVRIFRMRAVFMNGDVQDIPIIGKIRDESTTSIVRLNRPFVREIEIRYQTNLNFKGEGLVEFWVLKARRRR